jgi:hypothetical protein
MMILLLFLQKQNYLTGTRIVPKRFPFVAEGAVGGILFAIGEGGHDREILGPQIE